MQCVLEFSFKLLAFGDVEIVLLLEDLVRDLGFFLVGFEFLELEFDFMVMLGMFEIIGF